MKRPSDNLEHLLSLSISAFVLLSVLSLVETVLGSQPANEPDLKAKPRHESGIDLKMIPFRIIYETYRKTNGKSNWELCLINPDGTNETNLTQTPDVDEMYPHFSPDGRKISFVTDERTEKGKVRNVYYMNADGSDRVKVADHARWPCWSPDAKTVAYLKDEYYERHSTRPYSTKGLFFYDLATRRHKQHPNRDLCHLYNICWSPDGKWFLANVTGGMGFGSAIVVIEAQGNRVFDLTKYGVEGCRPDLCFDGKTMGWAMSNEIEVYLADMDLTLSIPRVTNLRGIAKCREGHFVNQADFSPDGQYIAFSSGPAGNYEVGWKSPGWNICVGDLEGNWLQITTDGKHNKEPDWMPVSENI
jgi:Tol biopolymer transport system component